MPKTTLTNQELADLANGLHGVKDLKGVNFALVVAKNMENITKELQHIDDASKPTDEFLKVAEQIQALAKEQGKEEEIKKLEKENEHLTEERKKQLDEVNELLQDEIELNLAELAEKDLPDEITGKELASIALIIK